MNRIEHLEAKLAAREGKPGYEKNVEAIKAEIARLDRVQAEPGDADQSHETEGQTDEDG